jgi:hypothetical protein
MLVTPFRVNSETVNILGFPSSAFRYPEFVNTLNNELPPAKMYLLVSQSKALIHEPDLVMFHQTTAAGTKPTRLESDVAILTATFHIKTLVLFHPLSFKLVLTWSPGRVTSDCSSPSYWYQTRAVCRLYVSRLANVALCLGDTANCTLGTQL